MASVCSRERYPAAQPEIRAAGIIGGSRQGIEAEFWKGEIFLVVGRQRQSVLQRSSRHDHVWKFQRLALSRKPILQRTGEAPGLARHGEALKTDQKGFCPLLLDGSHTRMDFGNVNGSGAEPVVLDDQLCEERSPVIPGTQRINKNCGVQ